ncbi:urease accessory protein UreD [Rhodovulum sp. DZ06]|uniref:urease accessory protein UreD n=1 Tax=Rhodovulum sp. DZ06 TaxID=3425126 RepID=UPI003D328604
MGMIETIQGQKPTEIPADAPKQPRAVGEARVGAGAESRLKDLRQAGCCKALLPMTAGPGLDAVLVNTAGGITGGDRILWGGAAAGGARLTLTTQACERGYRAQPGESGEVRAELSVADGGRIDWLPQETILFDHCALSRRFDAALEGDAALLACESVLFGRAAMGERLEAVEFTDAWRVRRDGKLVFADTLRLSGPDALGRAFCLDGAGACATILLAAPGAADMERGAREALGDAPGAGLSLVADDILVARLLAPSGFALRRRMIPLLAALRGAPLPKVWTL